MCNAAQAQFVPRSGAGKTESAKLVMSYVAEAGSTLAVDFSTDAHKAPREGNEIFRDTARRTEVWACLVSSRSKMPVFEQEQHNVQSIQLELGLHRFFFVVF